MINVDILDEIENVNRARQTIFQVKSDTTFLGL